MGVRSITIGLTEQNQQSQDDESVGPVKRYADDPHSFIKMNLQYQNLVNMERSSEINHPCNQMGTLGKIAVEEPRGRGRPRDGDCRERILRAGLELLEETAFADITTTRSRSVPDRVRRPFIAGGRTRLPF